MPLSPLIDHGSGREWDDAKKAADPAVSSVRSNNAGQKTTQFTRDQIKNMSLAEYEKHADQIDQAMLSGQL